ncbi:bifunctional helix-turn-helix transcriptional regulator/GNAT family N-acetyltransferase [Lewinella sp. W8]|uniref:bifunctional helix-turn-helix transcriptional regulator/GNAT family N-acetyltransferase n=1 Tax=Lewinella sp. W8 TaxID=2528208 RepID=UPI001067D84F|nr:bifunctional helix-turn-helix transcriptional regulator/GNAT family N-acetyltransferase [Lewinella sp. W8]MTB52695.1 GNAT family N-acetyltransferase [Lewinella sp. W8]
MDFFARSGPFAIGSRLRLLSERLQRDAGELNLRYGSDLKPKWFPVFYLLMQDGAADITTLAESIGQTHPAVVKVVNELARAGLVERRPDPKDGRRSIVYLTASGSATIQPLQQTIRDVDAAVAEIAAESSHDLWGALGEWERLLDEKALLKRTLSVRRKRALRELTIKAFTPEDQPAWHDLNEAWISEYFVMEEADYHSLRDPQSYVLDRGGQILIAHYRGRAVGTCALIPMEDERFDYELAKMAVSPAVQGLGFGEALGRATLELAWSLGAKVVYLETNDRLRPAIALYEKLGFRHVSGIESPYERCNVQMAVRSGE